MYECLLKRVLCVAAFVFHPLFGAGAGVPEAAQGARSTRGAAADATVSPQQQELRLSRDLRESCFFGRVDRCWVIINVTLLFFTFQRIFWRRQFRQNPKIFIVRFVCPPKVFFGTFIEENHSTSPAEGFQIDRFWMFPKPRHVENPIRSGKFRIIPPGVSQQNQPSPPWNLDGGGSLLEGPGQPFIYRANSLTVEWWPTPARGRKNILCGNIDSVSSVTSLEVGHVAR